MSEETTEKKKRPRTPAVEAGLIFNQLKKIDEAETAELARNSEDAIRAKHKKRRDELLAGINAEVKAILDRMTSA